MKKRVFVSFISLTLLLLAVSGFCDEQQKVQKEVTKVTAMAADFHGRRVVNASISEMFNVPRAELVLQRVKTGLNYGKLFLGQELIKRGMTADDLAAKLRVGNAITDIANQQHVDWKQVMEDAKKLNGAIDKNLFDSFLGKKLTLAQDTADHYDVHYDGVKADADLTQQDIANAQNRYLMWKERAANVRKEDHTLSYGDEKIAYSDHVSNSGPQSGGRGMSGSGGTSGPGAMGGVPH